MKLEPDMSRFVLLSEALWDFKTQMSKTEWDLFCRWQFRESGEKIDSLILIFIDPGSGDSLESAKLTPKPPNEIGFGKN